MDEVFPRCPNCGSCMTDTDRGSECMANVYNMGGCASYAELRRLRPLVAAMKGLMACIDAEWGADFLPYNLSDDASAAANAAILFARAALQKAVEDE